MANHTLTDGSTSVLLPGDMGWDDEFKWTPVSQGTEYTLTGALIVEESSMQAGRPITLSGADDRGWVSRLTCVQLYALASVLDKQMVLTLADGRNFDVRWRHKDGALDVTPVLRPMDRYYITVRLMQV